MIDPAKAGSLAGFTHRIERLVAAMHESGQARLPGDRRYAARERAARDGIPMTQATIDMLEAFRSGPSGLAPPDRSPRRRRLDGPIMAASNSERMLFRIGRQGPECTPSKHSAWSCNRTSRKVANMTMIRERKTSGPMPSLTDDPRWARIVAHDKTADGHFWFSVATTGVYCRPVPARSAPRSPRMSRFTTRWRPRGRPAFRPCKRCRPEGPSIDAENAALVAKACRLIETSEDEPSLADLAEAAGRSPCLFSPPSSRPRPA